MNHFKNLTERVSDFARASLTAVMLLVAILAMLVAPPPAKAQTAAITVPLWTNAVLATVLTTNVANQGFSVQKGKHLSLILEYKNHVASGTNGPFSFYMDGSIDNGAHYTTTFPLVCTASNYRAGWGSTNTEIFTLPATNGSLIRQLTHLKVTKFSNALNTNVVTNIVITARWFD
jgi:hypothetical protein